LVFFSKVKKKGDTPLHIAIIKENIDLIMILLENNAKLDIKNKVRNPT